MITDLRMPRMSGLELMAALRKAGSAIPVILTTFYGSEQAAIQAFRLGAKDYIIKPYEVKDMLESVERAFIEQRLRRESRDLQSGVQIGQHLEGRVRQLHSLCGIGKAITSLHDGNEAMRVMVEAAIYLTGAASGQLFLTDPETQKLELRAIRGPSDSRARCMRQMGSDRIAAQVMQTGKPMIAERDSGGRDKVPRLAVPLRSTGKTIGVLGVDAKPGHNFDDNDRYLMGILGDFCSVAVLNTRLIEDLKGQIVTLSNQPNAKPGSNEGLLATASLTDSISEAERLSHELRNLAAAAQVLAAKLQVASGG
ncbi:MAG: response regulator [Anaerolineae bacterium]